MKKHIEITYKNFTLRGYLDYSSATDCIIVVHGIGGNKLGNKFIFNQFATQANIEQLSTLRIDFVGTGESDGDYKYTNHLDQAKQLNEIINYALNVCKFKTIHIVGTSIGCLVILQSIKLFKPKLGHIVLWNPNIDIATYKYEFEGTKEDMDMGGLHLLKSYIDQLDELNIEYDYSQYSIAILHGNCDYNYKSEYVKNFCNINKCYYETIEGGDHLFESIKSRSLLFDASLKFIKSSLN